MKPNSNENRVNVLFPGLDGSNPLAFLAAIGATVALSRQASITLAWDRVDGNWIPQVYLPADIGSCAAAIHQSLQTELPIPWTLSKKLPFEATVFRSSMIDAIQTGEAVGRKTVDSFASLGSEVYCDDKGQFQDTAFRMVRSGDAAGQGLPDYACKLARQCQLKDIEAALFGPWTYSDSLSSFRWDPNENREYALQAINPSKAGSPTPIGVNRLAIEALSLYPTMPGPRGLETVGFIKASRGKSAEFRWPIWEVPLEIDSIRTLLTCPAIFSTENVTQQLRAMGIATVYCARQIKPNQYYRNFTPSFQL